MNFFRVLKMVQYSKVYYNFFFYWNFEFNWELETLLYLFQFSIKYFTCKSYKRVIRCAFFLSSEWENVLKYTIIQDENGILKYYDKLILKYTLSRPHLR